MPTSLALAHPVVSPVLGQESSGIEEQGGQDEECEKRD